MEPKRRIEFWPYQTDRLGEGVTVRRSESPVLVGGGLLDVQLKRLLSDLKLQTIFHLIIEFSFWYYRTISADV
jgi:NAD(P)H-nitrite reductase large subunit